MLPYLAVFAIGALASLIESLGLRRTQVALLGFQFWLLLALFAGLRGPTVTDDYYNYKLLFETFVAPIEAYLAGEPLPFLVKEPIFFLLMSGTRSLDLEFAFFIFAVAVLATWIVFRSVQIYSPYPLLSLVLYFAHNYLNREMVQLQSGLAIAIVLYAIRYISERQPLKYYALIAAATCVHVVAFIMVPFYLILRFRFSNGAVIFFFAVALGLAAFDWIHPLLDAGVAIGIVPSFVAEYIGYAKYDRVLGVLNNIATLKQIAILLPLILFREQLEARFSYFRELFLLYAAGTFWLIATHHMAILAARVATVFSFGEIVLIAMLISLVRERFPAYCLAAALAVLSLVGNLYFKGAWHEYRLVIG